MQWHFKFWWTWWINNEQMILWSMQQSIILGICLKQHIKFKLEHIHTSWTSLRAAWACLWPQVVHSMLASYAGKKSFVWHCSSGHNPLNIRYGVFDSSMIKQLCKDNKSSISIIIISPIFVIIKFLCSVSIVSSTCVVLQ